MRKKKKKILFNKGKDYFVSYTFLAPGRTCFGSSLLSFSTDSGLDKAMADLEAAAGLQGVVILFYREI